MAREIDIGVSGQTRHITEGYVGVDGQLRRLKEGYVGVGGVPRVFYMAGTPLGSIPEGNIVKLNESGAPVEFYVAKHDYESGLNGAGRTLLVRKDCYELRAWDHGNINAYATSGTNNWLNKTYKALLDPAIQTAVGTTTFYYTPGERKYNVTTLDRSIFILSLCELGKGNAYANVEGTRLPIADTLKIANYDGGPTDQWTRSPSDRGEHYVLYLDIKGSDKDDQCQIKKGIRPVFTLSASMMVGQDGVVVG